MYKIAICDDDSSYRNVIKQKLEEFKQQNEFKIYEYDSGDGLLDDLNELHDLIFLDIQMPGVDGNVTAKKLREINSDAILVFCTGVFQPTPDNFKVQPFRYIIKDFQDKMLQQEMPDIIGKMIKCKEKKYLVVTFDGTTFRIPLNDILYIGVQKRGAKICIYENKETRCIYCKEKVKELYDRVKLSGFEYAHNSYVVNLANIIEYSKSVIKLIDKSEMNVSRSKKCQFDESFTDFCLKEK